VGINVVTAPTRWRPNAWYSRGPLTKFVSGQAARAVGQRKLREIFQSRHGQLPYEAIYQFSQIESFGASGTKTPAIVLHPEVHAAGELKWWRAEAPLVRRCEPLQRRVPVRAMLETRAALQRRHIHRATRVVAPSRAFADELRRDYAVEPRRLVVVPNPINMARFEPKLADRPVTPDGPLRIVFISRIAVRKGVELVVELSHRLSDLTSRIEIDVIGDKTLWCDYRPLLSDLHPGTARYHGKVPAEDVGPLVAGAAMLIQPSHYEPFALTVGEALASGTPVVASDVVGATEGVAADCCRTFRAPDVDELELRVRKLLDDMADPPTARRIRSLARAEAERLFTPSRVAADLAAIFDELQTKPRTFPHERHLSRSR
jgi:glycosyltransferase involved in cell wall biosynthesis